MLTALTLVQLFDSCWRQMLKIVHVGIFLNRYRCRSLKHCLIPKIVSIKSLDVVMDWQMCVLLIAPWFVHKNWQDLQHLCPVRRTQSSSCATLYLPNICMWPNLALNYIKSLYNTQICPIIVSQKGFPTLSKFKKASTSNNSSLSACRKPRNNK